jgi:biotin carboxylase
MPESSKPTAAVVVDPYSSGRFLVYELQQREVPIICVRSSLELSPYFLRVYDSHKHYFAETIDYPELGSIEALVAKVQCSAFEVTAVFAGSEPGVELAEYLSEALQLPTANGTGLLAARKDKAEMQDRLRACGVPAAAQFKSGKLDELLSWACDRNEWPLVAKPTGGSGSDGVFFCQGEDDLVKAHQQIIGAVNPNGVMNTDIALQEFLNGDEYIVDTVSRDGKHLIVAIWVYRKSRGLPWNPTAIISKCNVLLASDGEVQDQLANYAFQVLDAVGYRNGPCHTELMLTQRGPILVEVNTRLHGLQGPYLIGLATGTSKATYTADVLVDNGKLFNELYQPSPGRYLYPRHKYCVQLVLISPVEGYLKTSIQATISSMLLPSVIEVLPSVQRCGYIRQSCDLCTSAGQVLMVHESEEQIEADIQRIRDAEQSGELYPVSAEPLPDSPKLSPKMSPLSVGSGSPGVAPRSRMCSMEGAVEMWASLDELPEAADVTVQMTGLEEVAVVF